MLPSDLDSFGFINRGKGMTVFVGAVMPTAKSLLVFYFFTHLFITPYRGARLFVVFIEIAHARYVPLPARLAKVHPGRLLFYRPAVLHPILHLVGLPLSVTCFSCLADHLNEIFEKRLNSLTLFYKGYLSVYSGLCQIIGNFLSF